MTALKRSRKARWPSVSSTLKPDRCGGIASSSISFSEHEMIRTQGLPECLMAGKRITLSTQITSGSILGEDAGKVLFGPFRRIYNRFPALPDVVVELLDRLACENSGCGC